MMTQPGSPFAGRTSDRLRALRLARRGAALLMCAGILAGCLFPGVSGRSGTHAAPEPTPAMGESAAAPPNGSPLPVSPSTSEPKEPQAAKQGDGQSAGALPEVPDGEPSLLVAHGDRTCKAVALTYDAGSGADGAAAILDVLKKYGLRSTFFLTGRWAEKFPDLAKRIAAEGHEIGNHTYSHPDLTTLPDDEVLRQIREAEEAIRKATGRESRPLFREPYGAFSEHERRLVRQAGYAYSIYWDVDTLDWQFPDVETLVSRIMKARGGSIVLMHVNVADTALASDRAIPMLQAKGYQLVTVSQLLRCTGQE